MRGCLVGLFWRMLKLLMPHVVESWKFVDGVGVFLTQSAAEFVADGVKKRHRSAISVAPLLGRNVRSMGILNGVCYVEAECLCNQSQ
jgi:hypothetical protein